MAEGCHYHCPPNSVKKEKTIVCQALPYGKPAQQLLRTVLSLGSAAIVVARSKSSFAACTTCAVYLFGCGMTCASTQRRGSTDCRRAERESARRGTALVLKKESGMSTQTVMNIATTSLLTIAHLYGSGGSLIARELGHRLNWPVWDKEIVRQIASQRLVPEEYVEAKDERVESIMSRVAGSLGISGFEKAYNIPPPLWLKDAELAEMTRTVIREVADSGRAIIVGRGGACILSERPATLHLFIFAPLAVRVERVMQVEGLTQAEAERRIVSMDRLRTDYVRTFYHADWRDPSHYNLMIDSGVWGEEGAVDLIMRALGDAA